ncbi:MAG: outer membrane protein assembly factor BamE [Gammaproteobacteria bacterium]|nr:outer membrane protein assembly factor BamE [Gammaproteobacteria bacterium]
MSKDLLLTILLTAFLASGCVYKLNVNQGNRVTAEDIADVEIGMTRSQVRFLLGTPMIADPFHQARWDYVYYFRNGKTGKEVQRRFIVNFDGDIVSHVTDEKK